MEKEKQRINMSSLGHSKRNRLQCVFWS